MFNSRLVKLHTFLFGLLLDLCEYKLPTLDCCVYLYLGPIHPFSRYLLYTWSFYRSLSEDTGISVCRQPHSSGFALPLTCEHFQSWMFVSSVLRFQGIGRQQLTRSAQCLAFLACISPPCSSHRHQPAEQRLLPPLLSLHLLAALATALGSRLKLTFFVYTLNFYLVLSGESLLSDSLFTHIK